MSQHYSEADLLETYYTKPGQSLPVMMHLADCTDCAARYERLERKVRALGACGHDEKPETFWSRQRISIARRIEGERSPSIGRMAAAAVLALVIGGTLAWPVAVQAPEASQQQVSIASASVRAPEAGEQTASDDPWSSGELRDLRPLVEWESWVDEGGHS